MATHRTPFLLIAAPVAASSTTPDTTYRMNVALTGIGAIALYAFGLFLILTSRADQATRAPTRAGKSPREPTTPKRWLFLWLSIAAIALHAGSVWSSLVSDDGINLSFFTIASLVGLALAGTSLGVANRADFPSLLAVTYAIAILAIVGSLVLPATVEPRTDLSFAIVFHIVASIAAYSALTMAAVHATLTLALENRLRSRESLRLVVDFPPLESMVELLFRLIWIGTALLTISTVDAFVVLDASQQVLHHIVLSTSSLIIYTCLLGGHALFGWRGKTTIRWTLVAFALLSLAYFGSKFVLEFVLGPQ